jgi:sugar phosphate isomerase/epimerase
VDANRPGRDVLWSAMLGAAALDVRIDAATANGFRGLTVRPEDLAALAAEGRDAREVFGRARDNGIEQLALEALTSWYAHPPAPAWFTSAAFTLDDHVRAAETTGARHANVVAPFPTEESTDSLTERFAAICDRFAEVGVAVHLEFIPLPPIGSLATAWEIVRGAGRPNGGILFDTWHFFRGQPDLELLSTIPGDRIFSVQFSDGAAEIRESLVKDTYRHRMVPGGGVFDLARVIDTLRATGGLRMVGPEVLSVELDRLTPAEAVGRAADALDVLLSRPADQRR